MSFPFAFCSFGKLAAIHRTLSLIRRDFKADAIHPLLWRESKNKSYKMRQITCMLTANKIH